jgi:hypothetical protein
MGEMKIKELCYDLRWGFIGGGVFILPICFIPSKWWSVNWIAIGWLAFCLLGYWIGYGEKKWNGVIKSSNRYPVSHTTMTDFYREVPLTIEKLEEAIRRLPRKIVIRFSGIIPEDKIFHGEMIDKILKCDWDEKGFLVPLKYKEALYKEGKFIER